MVEKLELSIGEHDIEVWFDNYHHGVVRLDVFDWSGDVSSHSVIRLSPQQAVRMALSLLSHAESADDKGGQSAGNQPKRTTSRAK